MAELFLPPHYKETDSPTLFLAGPIEGAWDWQTEAIKQIDDDPRSEGIIVASPRKDYSRQEKSLMATNRSNGN